MSGTTISSKFAPINCTLVIVDVQNDMCHPEGNMARTGVDVRHAGATAPRIQRVTAAARDCEVPIVWIHTGRHKERAASPAWAARKSREIPAPMELSASTNCLEGSWGAESFLVRPHVDDIVISKTMHSGFAGTPLEETLTELARPSLLFAGVATNVCVEATMRDALHRGFHVNMLVDCCAAASKAEHDSAVLNVRRYMGQTILSEELLDAWS